MGRLDEALGVSPPVEEPKGKRLEAVLSPTPLEEKQPYSGYNPIYAMAETSVALGSGMLATVPAGVAALGKAVFTDLDSAVDTQQQIQKMFTYEPRTPEGKTLSGVVMAPLEAWDNVLRSISDFAFDVYPSPIFSTSLYTALNFVDPIKAPTSVAKKAGASLADTVSINKAKLEEDLIKSYGDNSVSDSTTLANVNRAKEIQEDVRKATGEDFRFSLAPATMNPKIVRQQEAMRRMAESRKASDVITKIEDVTDRNFSALKTYWQSAFRMNPDITIQSMLDKVKTGKETVVNALNYREAKLLEDMQQIHDKVNKGVPYHAYGERLREIQLSLMEVAQSKGSAKYTALGDFDVSYDPIATGLDAIRNDNMYMQGTNPALIPNMFYVIESDLKAASSATPTSQIVDPATGKPFITGENIVLGSGVVGTFQKLIEYDKQIGIEIANNKAISRFDGNALKRNRFLAMLGKSVDQALEAVTAQKPELMKQYEDAKQYWKENVAEVYRTDTASNVSAVKRSGEYALNAEFVLENYFHKATKTGGGVKAVQDFKRIFSTNAEAMKMLYNHALTDMGTYARNAKDGTLNQTKITEWITTHNEMLNELPELKNHILQTGDLNETILTAIRDKRYTEMKNNNTKLANMYGSDPNTVMRSIISNPRKMAEFVRDTADDPGLRSQVIGNFLLNNVSGKFDPNTFAPDFRGISPKALADVLEAHGETIKQGMDPAHYRVLTFLSESLSRMELEPKAKTTVSEPLGVAEKVARKTGKTITSAINDARNASKPQTSRTGLAVAGAGTVLNGLTQSARLELEAAILYDREAAELMASALKYAERGAEPPLFRERVQKYLHGVGMPAYLNDFTQLKTAIPPALIQQEEQQ